MKIIKDSEDLKPMVVLCLQDGRELKDDEICKEEEKTGKHFIVKLKGHVFYKSLAGDPKGTFIYEEVKS